MHVLLGLLALLLQINNQARFLSLVDVVGVLEFVGHLYTRVPVARVSNFLDFLLRESLQDFLSIKYVI